MHFHFESRVPAPRSVLFDFHKNPAFLALLHSGWSDLRVLHHPVEIRVGAETWIEQTAAGFVPVVLGFRHHVYEPPFRFGEELIHGPFSRFVHIHEFTGSQDETVIADLLDVDWPWQFGGKLVMRWMIARHIRVMFQRRSEAMLRLWNDGVIEKRLAERCPSNPF